MKCYKSVKNVGRNVNIEMIYSKSQPARGSILHTIVHWPQDLSRLADIGPACLHLSLMLIVLSIDFYIWKFVFPLTYHRADMVYKPSLFQTKSFWNVWILSIQQHCFKFNKCALSLIFLVIWESLLLSDVIDRSSWYVSFRDGTQYQMTVSHSTPTDVDTTRMSRSSILFMLCTSGLCGIFMS